MLRIEWTQPGGAAAAIEADVCHREGHERTAEVTEHSVENGSSITDHAKANNATITVEGVISNTPLRLPTTQMDGVTGSLQPFKLKSGGSAQTFQFTGPFDRVRVCDALINQLIDDSQIVIIATHLKTYENMLITRFRVDMEAATGNSLPFTLEAKKLKLVSTQLVQVPLPAERRGQHRQQRGNQPGTPSPAPVSLLAQGLDALVGH